ncbi:spermidine synthase [Actinomadura madurae]|uniref:spermine/spermidine synthase domain-containing protein n=1 Tax=Actinomadura madurae TaxID=1993 RepID=UPI000DA0506F|nr:spermidine synthase [Actinomadura madurae]SPT57922.1 spermidine synthase [Actinomadura madurae]
MVHGTGHGTGRAAGTAGEPVVVERAAGAGGELVLRRDGAHYEIISNGVFLMDTRNGESERLLVRAAAEGLDGPVRILIGGLGVGFSLAEALALPGVEHVTVVEREPAVIGWHATALRPWSAGALDDPRVTVECADLLAFVADPGDRRFDALCLDIDNGPDWTVTPGNARLYARGGLDALAGLLTPRGRLAVWSANAAPAFASLLRDRFARVEARPVPVRRGEPDVVYLAAEPRPAAGPTPK